VSAPVFDFSDVFDEDYLYFYELRPSEASEGDVATIWRLLQLESGGCTRARVRTGADREPTR
jgi:hypothetical protein